MTPSRPPDWFHPQLQLHFSITLHLILPKQYSIQQPNLYYCCFTPLPHILLYIASSYTLPLTSLESPREAKVSPSGTRPTEIHSSHPVTSQIMNPITIPTDDPSIVLPTQPYTSIYFLRSKIPHMAYIPLWFPYNNHDPSTCAHSLPSEISIIQYWLLLHIHYLHHEHTHPLLYKLLE